ncbi:tetratricopeptide repeat protein [Sphingopyxis sp. GW247-27LB]|uniref:tetratricopeptide repeat protein n=1 Tax=Sphingopyxis sp. GW247-27LB TaxID=2012632 RepID=UPI00114105D3|nr:hypothetical protein [Sphingopyxis sp. GW247-27LB]
MFRPVAMIFAATLSLVAVPASADTQDDADSIAIGEAMDALRAKDFGQTVAKAQEIIGRFEAGRSPDTAYVCASGPGDTLTQLMSAAAAANEGSSKETATTVALSPNICDAYFLKGFALIDLGRRDDALPNLEAAVAMDPDNNHYANELGEWYKAGRQWEKSLEIFTRASETNDLSLDFMEDKAAVQRIRNNRRCRSYRGIAFNQSELRHWDEARAALDKCLAIVPGDEASLQELNYIAEQSGKDR